MKRISHFLALVFLLFLAPACEQDTLDKLPRQNLKINSLAVIASGQAEDFSRVWVKEERLYYTTKDFQRLHCVDLNTFGELWQYDLPVQTDFGFVQFARPTLQGNLFFGNSEECLVLDLSTQQLLHKTINPSSYTFVNRVHYHNGQLLAYAGDYGISHLLRYDIASNQTDTLYSFDGGPRVLGVSGEEFPFVYFTIQTDMGFNQHQYLLEYHQIRLSDTAKNLSYPLGEIGFQHYHQGEFHFNGGHHYVYIAQAGSIQAIAEDWQYNGVPWESNLQNSYYHSSKTSIFTNSANLLLNSGNSSIAFNKAGGKRVFKLENAGRALDLAFTDEYLLRREGVVNKNGPQSYQFYHPLNGDHLGTYYLNYVIDSTQAVSDTKLLAFNLNPDQPEEVQLRLLELSRD